MNVDELNALLMSAPLWRVQKIGAFLKVPGASKWKKHDQYDARAQICNMYVPELHSTEVERLLTMVNKLASTQHEDISHLNMRALNVETLAVLNLGQLKKIAVKLGIRKVSTVRAGERGMIVGLILTQLRANALVHADSDSENSSTLESEGVEEAEGGLDFPTSDLLDSSVRDESPLSDECDAAMDLTRDAISEMVEEPVMQAVKDPAMEIVDDEITFETVDTIEEKQVPPPSVDEYVPGSPPILVPQTPQAYPQHVQTPQAYPPMAQYPPFQNYARADASIDALMATLLRQFQRNPMQQCMDQLYVLQKGLREIGIVVEYRLSLSNDTSPFHSVTPTRCPTPRAHSLERGRKHESVENVQPPPQYTSTDSAPQKRARVEEEGEAQIETVAHLARSHNHLVLQHQELAAKLNALVLAQSVPSDERFQTSQAKVERALLYPPM